MQDTAEHGQERPHPADPERVYLAQLSKPMTVIDGYNIIARRQYGVCTYNVCL